MHQHTVPRRLVLVAALSVCALLFAQLRSTTAPARAQAPATLVVAGYTGSFEKGLESSVIPAFEKKYDCHITYVPGASTDTNAKLQAERAHPQIDVAIVDEGPQAQAASLGLFAPLDPSIVTNLASVYPVAKLPGNVGVAIGLVAIGLAYDTKVFAENHWPPLRSWRDLERPELKGKEVLPSITQTYGIMLLVMEAKLHGGSESDIDPGFAAMKKLAPYAVNFDKTADVSPYFLQGQAIVSVWGNSRTNTLRASGFPIEFVYPTEGAGALLATANLVKGAPHPKLAQEFINFLLEPQTQVTDAETVFFGPTNSRTKLPEKLATVVTTQAEVKKLIHPDWAIINRHRAEWTDRWTKEIETR
jgi:putative spermidine/putrescine transport system substrate-binding protein